MNWGNQHESRKARLMAVLHSVRVLLQLGKVNRARYYLRGYHVAYSLAPASTKRRWRCGQ